MLVLRLPQDIEKRLEELAAATGRTKSFYAREAILKHLGELEAVYLEEQRLIEKRKVHTEVQAQPAEKASGTRKGDKSS